MGWIGGGGRGEMLGLFLTCVKDEKMEIKFAPLHLHFRNRETPRLVFPQPEGHRVLGVNPQVGLAIE